MAGVNYDKIRDEVLDTLEKSDVTNSIILFKGTIGRNDLWALYTNDGKAVLKLSGQANAPEQL
jgi:hypothetical protein